LAEARLGALRMQLQPHFLFNCLNALSVVYRDQDTETAGRMVEQLGHLLRRVTRPHGGEEVPLAEELEFARQYLALEEIRFSDRLVPGFVTGPGVDRALVPEFILQPLVENAVRHGLARRSDATRIEIRARRDGETLFLTVTDDGPGPSAVSGGSGIGLANTRARLETLYGGEASLDLTPRSGGGAVATIRMPFREGQIAVPSGSGPGATAP
ncbi:MAG: sensor histidine kinase, partial [Gemmatimonadales bacterium]